MRKLLAGLCALFIAAVSGIGCTERAGRFRAALCALPEFEEKLLGALREGDASSLAGMWASAKEIPDPKHLATLPFVFRASPAQIRESFGRKGALYRLLIGDGLSLKNLLPAGMCPVTYDIAFRGGDMIATIRFGEIGSPARRFAFTAYRASKRWALITLDVERE